jgi:hypothetical protein
MPVKMPVPLSMSAVAGRVSGPLAPGRYAFEVRDLRLLVTGALLAAAIAACAFFAGRASAPAEAARVGVRSTPGVIMAIHDVAKLETTVFHVEKVVEVTDAQSRLWGLVKANDALLLVAVGDVVAGVDLAKVSAADVRTNEVSRTVSVRLPAPEIVTATLDEQATRVYRRSTELLAERNEQLEGEARRTAEVQMRKAAVDEGILDRARVGAESTVRALLRPLGYDHVEIDWGDRG